jgi:hypothetical protein
MLNNIGWLAQGDWLANEEQARATPAAKIEPLITLITLLIAR